MIATNLSAAFHTTRVAIPGMKKRKWGRIINIASAHGLVASGEKVAYVAAKHGIVGLTKVVAIEAANDGITCNAICPGWVLTPLVQAQIEARAKAQGKTVEQAKNELRRREAADAASTRRRRTSARSRCSSPAMPPRPSRARPTRSTAAGPRSDEAASKNFGGEPRSRSPPQENQSRPAGRRRARRIHLGRARLSARGRAHRHRGHFRHLGRRDECRDAGRRARARRAGGSAQAARRVLARREPRRQSAGLQRSVLDRLFSFTPFEGSPVQAWFDAVARYMSPYDLNPLNINPLRDLIERFVDFDAVRACKDVSLFISATNVHTGRLRIFPQEKISRRRRHGVGLPAVPVSRGRDRRRALLGRRLHGQSGDLPVLRRDADRGRADRADQSGRARRRRRTPRPRS